MGMAAPSLGAALAVFATSPNYLPAELHNLVFVALACVLVLWVGKLARQALIASELRTGLRRGTLLWADAVVAILPDIEFLRKRQIEYMTREDQQVAPVPMARLAVPFVVPRSSVRLVAATGADGRPRQQLEFQLRAAEPCAVQMYWDVPLERLQLWLDELWDQGGGRVSGTTLPSSQADAERAKPITRSDSASALIDRWGSGSDQEGAGGDGDGDGHRSGRRRPGTDGLLGRVQAWWRAMGPFRRRGGRSRSGHGGAPKSERATAGGGDDMELAAMPGVLTRERVRWFAQQLDVEDASSFGRRGATLPASAALQACTLDVTAGLAEWLEPSADRSQSKRAPPVPATADDFADLDALTPTEAASTRTGGVSGAASDPLATSTMAMPAVGGAAITDAPIAAAPSREPLEDLADVLSRTATSTSLFSNARTSVPLLLLLTPPDVIGARPTAAAGAASAAGAGASSSGHGLELLDSLDSAAADAVAANGEAPCVLVMVVFREAAAGSAASGQPRLTATVVRQFFLTRNELVDVEDVYNLGSAEADECAVCMSEPKSVILLPCRHICVCGDCVRLLDKCPVCRAPLLAFVSPPYVPGTGTAADAADPLAAATSSPAGAAAGVGGPELHGRADADVLALAADALNTTMSDLEADDETDDDGGPPLVRPRRGVPLV